MQNPVFSAGDLIGIYASFRDNIQQCEAVIPAGKGATGSQFSPYQALNSGAVPLLIGAAPSAHTGTGSVGLYFDGAVDMLILGDGRVVNLDNNRLQQISKRSWYPMWVGTEALNGIGGHGPVHTLSWHRLHARPPRRYRIDVDPEGRVELHGDRGPGSGLHEDDVLMGMMY